MGMAQDPEDGRKASEQVPSAPRSGTEDDRASLRRSIRRRLKTGGQHADPPSKQAPTSSPEIIYRRDLPHASPTEASKPPSGAHANLTDLVVGKDIQAPDGGQVFLVDTPIAALDPKWQVLCDSLCRSIRTEESPLRRHLASLCQSPPGLQDVLFLDLETTGLGSSPLFLIGTMVWADDGLVVRQYFARDYSQERAAISMFLQAVTGKKLLVSFNGKSFDLPYVRVRSAATGLAFEIQAAHLDLLHVSRRVWGGSLSDCRLQTLERAICGRLRTGDIPGNLIPQAYHDYVRTGDATQMADCLQHNMLDLVTLADLATRLPEPEV